MTADRMERVREKVRKLEHAGYYVAETELIVKGAEMFRTLTDAEWEQTREEVAQKLMERADLVNLGAAGAWADDDQLVTLHADKHHTSPDHTMPGCRITITPLEA